MRFLFRKMAREMKSRKAPGSDLGLESSIRGYRCLGLSGLGAQGLGLMGVGSGGGWLRGLRYSFLG